MVAVPAVIAFCDGRISKANFTASDFGSLLLDADEAITRTKIAAIYLVALVA
jgi:hypothetical protein